MTAGSAGWSTRLVDVVRRWAVLLVAAPLLAGAAAFLTLPYVTPRYDAVLTLLIEQGATPGIRDDQALKTYAESMKTRPVLAVAAERTGLQLPFDELTRRVSVAVVQDTQLLRVTASDSDPVMAARLANAMGDVLAARQADSQAARAANARTTLTGLVEQRRDAMVTAVARLENARQQQPNTASPDLVRLQSDVTQAQAAYEVTIRDVEATLLADAQAGAAVRVVAPAVPPDKPVFPNPALAIGLACLAGLAVAAGIVALGEQVDDRLPSADAAAAATGLPALGAIPLRRDDHELVPGIPRHAAASYGLLLRSFVNASLDRDVRSLVVASGSEGEGRSSVAAGLAVTIAESGRSVVLVDADFHGRSQAELFRTANGRGLTDILADVGQPIDDVLRSTAVSGLTVLSAGTCGVDSSAFWSHALSVRLGELRAKFDVVILDSPALGVHPDAALIGPELDAVLLVVDATRSRRGEVLASVEKLQRAGARVLGLVVNRVESAALDHVTPVVPQPSAESRAHAGA